jgi:hypothetical protein
MFQLSASNSPGRFFAANEVKAMLCYTVMNYDVKLPGGSTVRPCNQYFGNAGIPSQNDEVLVKRRQVE